MYDGENGDVKIVGFTHPPHPVGEIEATGGGQFTRTYPGNRLLHLVGRDGSRSVVGDLEADRRRRPDARRHPVPAAPRIDRWPDLPARRWVSASCQRSACLAQSPTHRRCSGTRQHRTVPSSDFWPPGAAWFSGWSIFPCQRRKSGHSKGCSGTCGGTELRLASMPSVCLRQYASVSPFCYSDRTN